MSGMWHLAAFGAVVCFFHLSEFALAAVYMRDQLSFRSLLVSWPYTAAMSAGMAEYFLESHVWPQLKQQQGLAFAGLVLVIVGEALRKLAMMTAACNFTHDIQHTKRPGHQLVTTGIYRYVRHPGYMGWFIWSVATQLLLVNPVCTLVFANVSWRFFQRRIAYEDWTLGQFFGEEHAAYAANTPSGIPFVP